MHDDVHWASLLFVFGLLLGNYGYQTDRKIYDEEKSQLACDPRVNRALRAPQNNALAPRELLFNLLFPTSSYVAEITHPFAMADRGS